MPKDDYSRYINSTRWRQKREAALVLANHKCQGCGFRALKGLHVHHKTYENFRNERLEDLEVLCEPCHMAHHERVQEKPWLWSGRRYSVRKRANYEVFDRKTKKVLTALKTLENAIKLAQGADSTATEEIPEGKDISFRRGSKVKRQVSKKTGLTLSAQKSNFKNKKRNRRRKQGNPSRPAPLKSETAEWLKQVKESDSYKTARANSDKSRQQAH